MRKGGIAVVDLFAGPGGLAEGFASVKDRFGNHPFKVVLSVEKESAAHATLLLRTFLRKFEEGFPTEYYNFLNSCAQEPDWSGLYRRQWDAAQRDALRLELGLRETDLVLNPRIDEIRKTFGGEAVLIGGPPCQAYSLVGRARNVGVAGYVPEKDAKHTLYRNYIKVLTRLEPVAFVMENVKGMLSSSLNQTSIFDRVLEDLSSAGPGYKLMALDPRSSSALDLIPLGIRPTDFILRSEDFGIPQARHRVIVVGIRSDIKLKDATALSSTLIAPAPYRSTVEDVLSKMPRLRSGISGIDSVDTWISALEEAGKTVCKSLDYWPPKERHIFQDRVRECVNEALGSDPPPRVACRPNSINANCPTELRKWLIDPRLQALPNNETRSHMQSDLARYLYAAVYGELLGQSPKAMEFPDSLAPDHRNWDSGKFKDRFRVQIWGQPSTTITSHISKDGHYFIHPDPEQCRSLTVREAARLQSFPDNYLFRGNRTQQFIQVGNAVPPLLANKIAHAILELLRA